MLYNCPNTAPATTITHAYFTVYALGITFHNASHASRNYAFNKREVLVECTTD